MSTPVRPKRYQLRSDQTDSVISRPMKTAKKRVASPIRFDPISREAAADVTNAPKAKRKRESRLRPPLSKIVDLPFENSPPSLMPIPRLYFENEDFMELYSDEPETTTPGSVTRLSKCLTDAFNAFLSESPTGPSRLSTLRPRPLRTPDRLRFRKKLTSPKPIVSPLSDKSV